MVESSINVFSNTNLNILEKWKKTKSSTSLKNIRYDWSQTNESVFLTIYKKNVKEEDFFYYIIKNYIFLTLKINDEEIYNVELHLFSSVLPENTKINITPMKVEVIFKKEIKEMKWDDLKEIRSEDKRELKKEDKLNPFSGRSSEEWNQLVNCLKQEEQLEEDDCATVDQFFKKLYNEGDADTKRAMIKSFQTSSGKVLSTNWKDVEKKNYEEEIKQNSR